MATPKCQEVMIMIWQMMTDMFRMVWGLMFPVPSR